MDLKDKVMWGLRWSAGAKFLGQLITWGITVIIIRLLTPADYGLMEMAGVFVAFLVLFSELGLSAAVIQRPQLDAADLPRLSGLLLLICVLLFGLMFAGAQPVAQFFGEPRLAGVVEVLSLQFLLLGFAILPYSLLQREMEFKKLASIDFASAVSGALVTLGLALAGFGVWALVWGSLVVRLVVAVGVNLAYPCRYLPSFDFKGMRSFFTFGGYVTLFRILWYFFNKADALIIGKLLGKQLLGFYAVGLNLAQMPMDKVTVVINQVALPAFSTVQHDPSLAARHFLKAVRVMSFFAFPVLWGISSIAPELIDVFLGNKWAAAALPLQLIALIIPVRMVSNIAIPVAFGMGYPEINFRYALMATILLPLAFLVGAHWGLVGVSLAWVVVFPLIFICNMAMVVKVLGLRVMDVLTAMQTPVALGCFMYLGVLGLKRLALGMFPRPMEIMLLILTGVLIYSAMSLLFYRHGIREIRSLAKAG